MKRKIRLILGIFQKVEKVRFYEDDSVTYQDREMEFGIEKCAMLVMRSGKRYLTYRIELPNQEKIRTLGEKEAYKYFDILEAGTLREKNKERISQ